MDKITTTTEKKRLYEPMLDPKNSRYSAFPIDARYEDIWKMYNTMRESNWEVNEIDYGGLSADFAKLDKDEQHFIKHILAFFAQSDGLVNQNLATNFIDEIKIYEAQAAYNFQSSIEDVHNIVYSTLIESLVTSREEKRELFKAIETLPSIGKKAKWAEKWMDRNKKFEERVFAFAIVEGVFFSGAFCAIYWIKERGILQGLTHSNELISRDEGMHTDLAIIILKKLENKLEEETAINIMREAVDIETEFITDALPYRLNEMNSNLMNKYIRFVADMLMVQAGYSKIYGDTNPFEFMEHISMERKTNFFERRVADYAKNDNKGDDFNDYKFIDSVVGVVDTVSDSNSIEY